MIPKVRFWNDERLADLRLLWERGDATDAIASYFGVSYKSVKNAASIYGIRRPVNGPTKFDIERKIANQAWLDRRAERLRLQPSVPSDDLAVFNAEPVISGSRKTRIRCR